MLVDLFAEDRAHEELLRPLVMRLVDNAGGQAHVQVISARGGHPRVVKELELYQRLQIVDAWPADLIVIGIDSNCQGFKAAKALYTSKIDAQLQHKTVIAAPDPHVEAWYLADPTSFELVVGSRPSVPKRKCKRDLYKRLLADAVRTAGHVPTLGGIEFAQEIVAGMDLYRASKRDRALKEFIESFTDTLGTL